MNWMIVLAVLVAWCLIGLGVAYLFGRFIGGVGTPDDATDLSPPVLSYLRRAKRAKVPRARGATQIKPQRKAVGGHRLH